MKARSILMLVAMSGSAAMAEVGHPERYVQSRSGEIQILPALTLEEIPRGKVSGVESAGGFVFDIEWRENYMRDVISLCLEHNMPYCVWNYLSTPNDGNRFSLVDDDSRQILSPHLLRIIRGEVDDTNIDAACKL